MFPAIKVNPGQTENVLGSNKNISPISLCIQTTGLNSDIILIHRWRNKQRCSKMSSRTQIVVRIVWNWRRLCRDQGLVSRLIWHPLMTQTRFTKPPSSLSLGTLATDLCCSYVILFGVQVWPKRVPLNRPLPNLGCLHKPICHLTSRRCKTIIAPWL